MASQNRTTASDRGKVIDDLPDQTVTIGTATTLGTSSASITFTAGSVATGGRVTYFTATSTPGSLTGNASTSPVTVSGLSTDTAYTFKVKAGNPSGFSTAGESAASNSITISGPVAAYFAGGYTGSNISGIEKILFSNDSISTSSATLSTNKNGMAGAANSGTAAYFAGGNGASAISAIDKLAFPGDTISTLSATLTSARYALAGMANSGTAAYFSGGYDGSFLSGIDKVAFAADTKTTLAATLSPIRTYAQGLANSGVAGYTGPGYTGVGAVYTNTINKLLFSNDTISTLAATLTVDGTDAMCAANSGTAGYWAGGAASSGSTLVNSIDKLTFSGETKSTIAATLTAVIYSGAGAANSGTAAYFAGGTSPLTNRVDKIAFSGDTKTTLSATLASARQNMGGAANSGAL
jgi:hypothetical protein